ncbi:hypothetical protein [Coraliomargarita akajimensis]|uniref:Beta-agarase (Precursor) n=1 Tax=Coraliomargarita akajimensis (strain DSM 45221 / IAM 15411 / JCM 23193 / KCTC 12865 / 04OKA010-24) TaxID=583355 RepID=D5EN65_CORAD|nr:hypothetical protein [Coraliomargarita akajimensis]ADE53500.1 beta-agarase (precursor) [Coraliomargarita akajimensis DSM 45221]
MKKLKQSLCLLTAGLLNLSASAALSPETIEQMGEAGKLAYENHQHLVDVVMEKYPNKTNIQVNAQYEKLVSVSFSTEPVEVNGTTNIPVPLEIARHRPLFRAFQIRGEGLLGIKQVNFVSAGDGFREAKLGQHSDNGFLIEAMLASIKPGEEYWIELKGTGTVTEVSLANWEGIAVEFNPGPYIAPGLDKPILEANVDVDATAYRSIHGISEIKRDRYFRYYASPNMDRAGKEPYYAGKGFLPGRQIEKLSYLMESRYGAADRMDHLVEDPDRPGYADLSFFERNHEMFWRFEGVDPDLTFAMCFDNWPSFMEPKVEGISNNAGTPDNYDAATELAVEYLKAQIRDSGLTATWWEVKNECDIQSEWMWHGQKGVDSWGLLADFHNTMADGIHAEFPDLKVGGPASAWIQPHRANFGVWNNHKRFMELTKGKLDFYSHHFYEVASNNTYQEQWNGRDSYAQGIMECTLDMVKAQMTAMDHQVPMLITEYGTLNAPNGDLGFWIHVKNVNNLLVNLLDRPQDFDMTVPFILTFMHWDPHATESFIHMKDDGEFYKTKNTYLLDLWDDFNGRRLASRNDHRKIFSFAVLEGDTLRVVLNNRSDQRAKINLKAALPKGIEIVSASRKMPIFEKGEMLFIRESVKDLTAIDCGVEVTQVVELKLSTEPSVRATRNETTWYAPKTALKADQPVELKVQIAESDLNKKRSSARVRVGVQRNGGFEQGMSVSLNGQPIGQVDLSYSKGIQRYFDYFELDCDPALLAADNTVQVSFDEAGAYVTASKITLVTE